MTQKHKHPFHAKKGWGHAGAKDLLGLAKHHIRYYASLRQNKSIRLTI